ncbi:MAG TPA: hypothetical protein VGN69_02880 [Solirubrobacteraceae bacterium]|nr:hypothetical protein [Solirubrobacteraceae bacterium]
MNVVRHRRTGSAVTAALLGCLALAVAPTVGHTQGLPGVVDVTIPPNRSVEPIVLTGANFPDWAAPANQTVKMPLTDLYECQAQTKSANTDQCAHNHYAKPEADTGTYQGQLPIQGTPVDRLLGYKWNGKQFVQIPFQVDKMFTRYLQNDASGFAIYSGADQHTTYQYDREGFRFTQNGPDSNPCQAQADSKPATDPIQGLDTNDELAFMASDAGVQAPAKAPLPAGIAGAKEVAVADPSAPGKTVYAYVMKADASGPKTAFHASNGYVSYTRDANAGFFEASQSDYSNYGNAAVGTVCDAQGHVINGPNGKPLQARRRPRDYATITTPRYKFRYDGRWLLTGISISPDNGNTFGPNLVDRWKARAFQQDPSSKTPCCGFEEEDTHWGGSSTLLGERVGPVRAIRETWGADSGTNVIRRESFYRDQVRMKTWLRVHVIPPLDGIYAQWDFAAGRVDKYYNPNVPNGVAVDGQNDTVFGNLDDPCNDNYNANDLGKVKGTGTPLDGQDLNQAYRQLYKAAMLCQSGGKPPWCPPSAPSPAPGTPCAIGDPYHQSINIADPTFSSANASLQWNEVTGDSGTIIDRTQVDQATDLTPGGLAQSITAVPYYRDDSCFDDGTGNDPGIRVNPGKSDEPRKTSTGQDRKCWRPSDGIPAPGKDRFFQGDIGTHGLHLLFQAESDNARLTVPVDEIVSENRIVMVPGRQPNVGEQYGREFEKPQVATVNDYTGGPPASGGDATGGGGGTGGATTGGTTPGSGSGGGQTAIPADGAHSGKGNDQGGDQINGVSGPSNGVNHVAGFSSGRVSAANPLGLPSNLRCQTSHGWRLRLHAPRGTRIVAARVYVDGRLVARAHSHAVRSLLVPRLIQASQTIRVVALTDRHRRIVSVRSYRGCLPRAPLAGARRHARHRPRRRHL